MWRDHMSGPRASVPQHGVTMRQVPPQGGQRRRHGHGDRGATARIAPPQSRRRGADPWAVEGEVVAVLGHNLDERILWETKDLSC